MPPRSNADVIEFLKEEIERGEYSLQTHIDVVGRLKKKFPELSDRFNTAYTEYENSNEPVSEELVKEVIEAFKDVDEPEQPKPLII